MSYWPYCKNTKSDAVSHLWVRFFHWTFDHGSSSLLLCGSRYLDEWGEGQAGSEVSDRKNAKLSFSVQCECVTSSWSFKCSFIHDSHSSGSVISAAWCQKVIEHHCHGGVCPVCLLNLDEFLLFYFLNWQHTNICCFDGLKQTIKTEANYSTSPICSSTRLFLITNVRFLHFSTLQFKLKYSSSSLNTFSFISSNNWQSIKAHPHSIFPVIFQRNKAESESTVHYCFLVQVRILTEG